jgi:toxin ParE1/3/4
VARVVLTSPADDDAASIINSIGENAGVRVAARYAADFDTLYERLAQFPGSGSPRPALGAITRISVVLPYVVIYEHMEAEDVVMILRILHGRRRITRRLLGQPSKKEDHS